MTQQVIGQAAEVQNNLPVAVNIASTTAGTPITVTTAAPHGISVGEYFNVTGATDGPTNGNWLAGSGTAGSTLKLTVIPGGGNSTSAGSGGAAGTVLSLGFGVTTPILVDADAPSAALWNTPYEACLDQCAYLLYKFGDYVSFVGGGTVTGPLVLGTVSVTGVLSIGFASRNRNILSLADADATIDSMSGANVFVMRTSPGANRVITLRQSTSPLPVNGDWYEFTVFLGTSSHTVGLQREGSLDYVAVFGDGVGTSPYASNNQVATARVQLVGGVWRLISVGGGPVFTGSDS